MGFGYIGLVARKGAEVATKYFYVYMVPSWVLQDVGNPDRTLPFDIYVEAWIFGFGGTVPEGGVNKKEGTQSYNVVGGEPELEVVFTDQIVEAVKDVAFNGLAYMSTFFSDIMGISLYKLGWDGTITIENGEGNVTGVVYKTDGGEDLDDIGQVLIQGMGAY